MKKHISVALIGQPNVGKSTLFTLMTGVRQHIGNYPGVTVERKEGIALHNGIEFRIEDLPGIYALDATSPEEIIVHNALTNWNHDVAVNLVDASALARHLTLTLQLKDRGIPIVVAVTKNDIALEEGIAIDHTKLADLLGVPVVIGSAKDEGFTHAILDAVVKQSANSLGNKRHLTKEQRAAAAIAAAVSSTTLIGIGERSARIDRVVMHPIIQMPLFFLVLYLLFQMVFTLGDPLTGLLEGIFGWLGDTIGGLWGEQSNSLFKSFIVDGIIGGVGGVLSFTPNIFLLFFGIAFLEGSGYLARMAVIMDRYLTRFGLGGRSFLPMFLGFGCSVPAIMGARIIENKWERIATMMVIPFMSCSARLPVYVLLISAFIPEQYQGLAMFSIYLWGILMALAVAMLLRKTVLKSERTELLIELPRYALPTLSSLAMQTWNRGKHFLVKAGTVILAASTLLWGAATFPRADIPGGTPDEEAVRIQVEQSVMGHIGKAIEPAVALMGGDWRVGSALIAGLAAKEIFVSQMGILFSLGGEATEEDEGLRDKLRETYSPAAAIALLLFSLLSAPCIATFAIMRAETMSWKWPIIQFVGMTLIAYLTAVLAYTVGSAVI